MKLQARTEPFVGRLLSHRSPQKGLLSVQGHMLLRSCHSSLAMTTLSAPSQGPVTLHAEVGMFPGLGQMHLTLNPEHGVRVSVRGPGENVWNMVRQAGPAHWRPTGLKPT